MNFPQKLGWGIVGDWHFDASFGQSREVSFFVCLFVLFLAVLSLFAARGLSLAVARRSEFLVTCVQASHCCGFSVQRTQCLFFVVGCAEPLFAARGLSLVIARANDFLVTCVQASLCCGYCCCRALALEHRLSTCVARV